MVFGHFAASSDYPPELTCKDVHAESKQFHNSWSTSTKIGSYALNHAC